MRQGSNVERRLGHGAVALWLTEPTQGRGAEFLAMTAEHAERAGETALASDCFEQAGKGRRSAIGACATYGPAGRALRHRRHSLDDPQRRTKRTWKSRQFSSVTATSR